MDKKIEIRMKDHGISASGILYSTKGQVNTFPWGIQVTTDGSRVLYIPWESIDFMEEIIG